MAMVMFWVVLAIGVRFVLPFILRAVGPQPREAEELYQRRLRAGPASRE